MRPKTICHPEALADWRANDEGWDKTLSRPQLITGENINVDHNTLSKKQESFKRLLTRDIEEAIEREIGRCRPVRKEGEA